MSKLAASKSILLFNEVAVSFQTSTADFT